MAHSGELAKRGVIRKCFIFYLFIIYYVIFQELLNFDILFLTDGSVSLDLDALMTTKSDAVKALTGGIKMLFKNNKVVK